MIGTDGADLAELTSRFSTVIRRKARKEHSELLAAMTCRMIDDAVTDDAEWPRNPLSACFAKIDDAGREIDRTRMRDPLYDFGMEISFIPDRLTNSTYGIVHDCRDEWRRAWMRMAGARDFSYWNGSDRPSSMSKAEWDRREETWDRIMPSGFPMRHGFSARISEVRMWNLEDDPLKRQPSLESRKDALARRRIMARLVGKDHGSTGVLIERMSVAAKRMASPDGLAEIETEKSSLRLPQRITREIATACTRPDMTLA
jgi:hypothetical protein